MYNPLELSDCPSNNNLFSVDCLICLISLALPILPHQGISKPAALNCLLSLGAPPVSLRHLLAFHASWYYRLFIQPLFKLDADRVALDMCIAKKI